MPLPVPDRPVRTLPAEWKFPPLLATSTPPAFPPFGAFVWTNSTSAATAGAQSQTKRQAARARARMPASLNRLTCARKVRNPAHGGSEAGVLELGESRDQMGDLTR